MNCPIKHGVQPIAPATVVVSTTAETTTHVADADSAFALIGGEPALDALVARFYDLMELEPQYTELRAVHGNTLDDARQKLFWFLCGWMGGPDYFQERFGHPRLRGRHLPFSIGIKERDQWVACMDQAMLETAVPEPLRSRLSESFMKTADFMRNRNG